MNSIDIDLTWRGCDDAVGLAWTSDDGQGWMDGGDLDPSVSAEASAEAWRRELLRMGILGGRIHLR